MSSDDAKGWRPPTRRMFVAMLGAAAAAFAVKVTPSPVAVVADAPPRPWPGPTGKPRWIGHC